MSQTEPQSWRCPFCQHSQIVTDDNRSGSWHYIYVKSKVYNALAIHTECIRCLNPECDRMTIVATLHEREGRSGIDRKYWGSGSELRLWRLLPSSSSKPQPSYIPTQIVADYYEACKIVDLSPKPSATLVRRCLQGMIRDFCGISLPTLYREINELRRLASEDKAPRGVSPESVDAIDAVRHVGNIGAHMEGDVNVIIDVEPHEATLLIELVEQLFQEWYVARENRQKRLDSIKALADDKRSQKGGGAASAAIPGPTDTKTEGEVPQR
jgi:hypothetical protein